MKIRVLIVGLLLMALSPMALAEDVVLKYWMWDPNIQEMEQAMVDKFEETHPGIKIELTAIAPKEYWTKMPAMAAAKQMPDVFAMSSGYAEEFALQGALLRLGLAMQMSQSETLGNVSAA